MKASICSLWKVTFSVPICAILFGLFTFLLVGCGQGFQSVSFDAQGNSPDFSPTELASQIVTNGASFNFMSSPQNVQNGACSGAVLVELVNSSGSADTFGGWVGVPLSASPGILNFYSDPAWSDSNAGLLFASGAQNGTMSLDAISFTVSAATPTPSPSPSLTPSPSPSPSSSPTSTPVPNVTSFSGTSGSRFYVDGHLFSVVNPDQPYNLTNPDSQTLRFEVHSQEYWVTSGFSDLTNDGGAERSEIEGVSDFPVDADVHLTYEFMIESGGVNTAQWMVIGQLWSVCCSPPFAVEMRGEHMAINVRWSTDKTEHVVYLDPNPIQRDRYYTMDIRVNYAKGTAVVFRDGVQILNYQGPLGYGGSSHWEYGLYRAPTTNDIQAARYRNLVISP